MYNAKNICVYIYIFTYMYMAVRDHACVREVLSHPAISPFFFLQPDFSSQRCRIRLHWGPAFEAARTSPLRIGGASKTRTSPPRTGGKLAAPPLLGSAATALFRVSGCVCEVLSRPAIFPSLPPPPSAQPRRLRGQLHGPHFSPRVRERVFY
jgi:hypothetical protein